MEQRMRKYNRYLSQKNIGDITFDNDCVFPNLDLRNCFQGVPSTICDKESIPQSPSKIA